MVRIPAGREIRVSGHASNNNTAASHLLINKEKSYLGIPIFFRSYA